VVFVSAYLLLFLAMTLRPNSYDEAIVLTGSMQVAAGLLPHRDFYTLYGPAGFYILAALFKLFGQSLLIERLLDLLFRALIVASVYTIVSAYLRRAIAVVVSVATFFWLYGLLTMIVGTAVVPVSFLNLISTALFLPLFSTQISKRRLFAAGALAAAAGLFRYDAGAGLFVVHTCIVVTAVWLRCKTNKRSALVSTFWPYLLGFIVIILPPAIYYLSVSSLDPLLFDAVQFPQKYYHRSRNLPFPPIGLISFDNVSIYLPIFVIALSFYAFAINSFKAIKVEEDRSNRQTERLNGYFFSFALLALAMYSKVLVRTSVSNSYLAAIPTLLLVAALYQQRFAFRRPIRVFIETLTVLSVIAPAWSTTRELACALVPHLSVAQSLLGSVPGAESQARTAWCRSANAATRGLCFLPRDDEIQSIQFIDSHTSPDQKLFVGVSKHDKIFVNDMLIYFASQRLPATVWAEFDADLQNQIAIQRQVIQDLEHSTPPYIILASETDRRQEPNDSALSSGVTMLDDYISSNYRPVQTFGVFVIQKRIPSL
jgi:hypothetical protein